MTKVRDEELIELYMHLSVQSILDMKDNYGEVSISKLRDMNRQSFESYPIKAENKILAVMFVFDADEVYNIVVPTGAHFARNKEKCLEQIQDKLIELKLEKDIHALVYRKSQQVYSMYVNIGFVPRNEKNGYKIMEYAR